MRFIKNNSYNIIRLILNQFGMMVFGLVLSFATGGINNSISDKILLVVSIFATGFYMVLIYAIMWEQGARDIIRVESGRMKLDKLYGAKVALCANIPNLILALLVFVGFLFGHLLGDSQAASNLYGVAYMISSFIQATYLGIIKAVFAPFDISLTSTLLFRSLVYFFTVIPAVVTSALAYILGCKNFRIFPAKK
ncbi:MAG: hypothetical protein E7587_08955 [Ruminococcaceae bacterium]|nr:hypothetical protein [Oscillospiraceae bacterium]